MTVRVLRLVRYPLKSAGGEEPDGLELGRQGPAGDRAWACVAAGDGRDVLSAKDPRVGARLLGVRVRTESPQRTAGGGQRVVLSLRGDDVVAGDPAADDALTALLGRPVRLTQQRADGARMRRRAPDAAGLVPEWTPGVRPGEEYVAPLASSAKAGRFVDFAPVHLVTIGAIDGLRRRTGRAVRADWFRPNLVLDLPDDPAPGAFVEAGEVLLLVTLPTPRCIVPGVRTGSGGGDGTEEVDRQVLSTLARAYRVEVPGFGRAACFGVYAEVVRPGVLRVGDTATVDAERTG